MNPSSTFRRSAVLCGDARAGSANRPAAPSRCPRPVAAFSLIELLIVVSIIGILIAVLLPAMATVRQSASRAVCLTRLDQLGVAVHSYTNDFGGSIPYGPQGEPASVTNFYPQMGVVTSLLSTQSGKPAGLGILLQGHLTDNPNAVFCTSPDQPFDSQLQLSLVGVQQAQGSYYYRHGSGYDITAPPPTEHLLIDDLGRNRNGEPIRALATDTQFFPHESYGVFGIVPRSHHDAAVSNTLYADGSAQSLPNHDGRFDVELGGSPWAALPRILEVLEVMDEEF